LRALMNREPGHSIRREQMILLLREEATAPRDAATA
jgi:hypothetical protein